MRRVPGVGVRLSSCTRSLTLWACRWDPRQCPYPRYVPGVVRSGPYLLTHVLDWSVGEARGILVRGTPRVLVWSTLTCSHPRPVDDVRGRLRLRPTLDTATGPPPRTLRLRGVPHNVTRESRWQTPTNTQLLSQPENGGVHPVDGRWSLPCHGHTVGKTHGREPPGARQQSYVLLTPVRLWTSCHFHLLK